MLVDEDFFEAVKDEMSPEAYKSGMEKAARILAMMNLAKLRETYGVKQTEVEGFSQPNVSRLERRKDIKLSTLLEYLNSLDLTLEMVVRPRHKREGVRDKYVLLQS